ncbi:hypothetical protein NBE99_05440 [Thermosynechococcus sp. HN-54]|uniref:hypothetical protein n=1 Tax=Thermosynechococcus sp. HN-54 TaxID=2933959 RepID=UPI00202CDFB0|nr:hypothetical protein [Thermosynechococcus sp. HN-54]URR36579.1 hypothetical protein NBE99_05440 [Thermosynechococcus sp. HN-54]
MVGYRNRAIAILLALAGICVPGLHKFYLRQPWWGGVYLLLGLLFSNVPHGSLGSIARVACVIEAVWYLFQGADAFDATFNPQISAVVPKLSSPTPEKST